MENIKGYNRNLMGGRRPHRGIQKYGKYTFAERVKAEIIAYNEYLERVYTPKKK